MNSNMQSTLYKGKLRIGLDLDGVIIDHTRNKIKVAKRLGFDIRPQETVSEILENLMPSDTYRELQHCIYDEMSMTAKPVVYAIPTIRRISQLGHTLFIISRRHKRANDALKWLKIHGVLPFIPKRNIAFVSQDKDKVLFVRKFAVDIFLDDKVGNLSYVKKATYPVLFNDLKADINHDGYTEVRSWPEFRQLVERWK